MLGLLALYLVPWLWSRFVEPRPLWAEPALGLVVYDAGDPAADIAAANSVELQSELVREAIAATAYERGTTAAWKVSYVGVLRLGSGESLKIRVNGLRPAIAIVGDRSGYYVIRGPAGDGFARAMRSVTEEVFIPARLVRNAAGPQ